MYKAVSDRIEVSPNVSGELSLCGWLTNGNERHHTAPPELQPSIRRSIIPVQPHSPLVFCALPTPHCPLQPPDLVVGHANCLGEGHACHVCADTRAVCALTRVPCVC